MSGTCGAASSRHIYFSRLIAGTDNKDLERINDELPNVEVNAEREAGKRVRINVPASESVLPPSGGLADKIKRGIIAAVLFVAWCIYTTALITRKEEYRAPVLVVVASQQEHLFHMLAEPDTKSTIHIFIKGPIDVHQDDKVRPAAKEPQLLIQVMLDAGDSGVKAISEMRGLRIQRPHELEYVVSVSKKLVIDLTEDISKYEGKAKIFLKMKTNIGKDLTLKISCNMTPLNEALGITYGTFVLLFLYVLIIWEIINRTLASIVASMLAIGTLAALNERPSTSKILSWLDVETLMLLFGMMVLVAILSESGIFDYLAVMAYDVAQGKLSLLIFILCFFTAMLSAFLDNVTMMLLMTPVIIRLCEVTNLNPVPVLMSLVLYSNVGAAFTPVGDPPNIIIMNNQYVNKNGISFGTFIAHMMPGVIIALLTIYVCLRIKYPTISGYMNKQSLEVEALTHEIQVWEKAAHAIQPTTTDEEIVQSTLFKKANVLRQKLTELKQEGGYAEMDFETSLKHMKAAYPIRNKTLLIKASIAFAFVLFLFSLHVIPNVHHLSLGWSALVGAILIIILANADIEALLSRIEWSTLIFFACLFIMMEALTELGLIGALGQLCVKVILKADPSNRLLVALLIILWVTGLASAFLDNIPVSTMMVKIVVNLSQNQQLNLPLSPLVWALAFGACFGGNGTLIGASANVVSSGVAEQHGYRFSFVDFFLFGFPITLCTLVSTTIYLYLAHCFWTWH